MKTRPTRVSGSIERPLASASPKKMSTAKRVFIVTPASVTTIRFQTGLSS